MPSTKKPKRKYVPREKNLNFLMGIAATSLHRSQDGLRPTQVDQLILFSSSAWQAANTGFGEEQDLAILGSAANMSVFFCDADIAGSLQYRPDAVSGALAVASMYRRFNETGRIGMSGEERNALAVMMDLHHQQAGSDFMTESHMVKALQRLDAMYAANPGAQYIYPTNDETSGHVNQPQHPVSLQAASGN